MNYSYTTARQFPAGHLLASHPRCGHDHGHDWTIAVTVSGSPYFRGDPESNLHARLDAFVAEIRGKSLNALNPAGTPDHIGLAMWAWERLAMNVPGLSAIEVSTSEERARVSA